MSFCSFNTQGEFICKNKSSRDTRHPYFENFVNGINEYFADPVTAKPGTTMTTTPASTNTATKPATTTPAPPTATTAAAPKGLATCTCTCNM